MKRHFFIVVPCLVPTGPVRGAVALANGLARSRAVTLVSLRGGAAAALGIDRGVEVLDLSDRGTWRSKRAALVARLLAQGGRAGTALVSYCLSADVLSVSLRGYTRVLVSIRGNLPVNYRHDYGWPGVPLAYVHLYVATRADDLIAMSQAMSDQIKSITGRESAMVSNFIDEEKCAAFAVQEPAAGDPALVFVGSLSTRKKPLLLLEAFDALLRERPGARLHVVGDGPLLDAMKNTVRARQIDDAVTFYGQMDDPLEIVNRGDILVAPSLAEGISRAVMEALFLGLPCVIRRSDGNSDLIDDGRNGFLFDDDADLGAAIRKALRLADGRSGREILLPEAFRQSACVQSILKVAEST